MSVLSLHTVSRYEKVPSTQDPQNIRPSSPIVVDLDGTLVTTDTLVESIFGLAKNNPGTLLRLPFWLLKGRAGFKRTVAAHTRIDVEHLPYHGSFLTYLRNEKDAGRRIILATAADESIAHSVADHLGL